MVSSVAGEETRKESGNGEGVPTKCSELHGMSFEPTLRQVRPTLVGQLLHRCTYGKGRDVQACKDL